MIIDAHAHFWWEEDMKSQAWRAAIEAWNGPKTYPPDFDLTLKEYDEAGIDKAVILSSNQGPAFEFSANSNDVIADVIKQYPDRFIGFGAICAVTKDKTFDRQSLNEIDRCINNLGFKGIKLLIPYWGDILPTDAKLYPLYAKIEELGVPITVHLGFCSVPQSVTHKHCPPIGTMQYQKSIYLDDVARDFPDLKIIVAHVGLPWIEETCLLMQKNPNIYADIAGINYANFSPDYMFRVLFMAKDYRVINKVFWGTDGPNAGISGGKVNRYGKEGWDGEVGCSFTEYLDLVRVEANKYAKAQNKTLLTETEIQNILGNGIAKLLGIKV